MNKRQALAATFAVPIIAFVILLPPHRVTGSVEARTNQQADIVTLSLGKTWVLRPHGSAQSVTLDIDAPVFTAVSRRDYELMLWPWLGSLFSVLALALGALFVLRSPRAPKPVGGVEPADAPGPVGQPARASKGHKGPLPPSVNPRKERTRSSKKTTWTMIDGDN